MEGRRRPLSPGKLLGTEGSASSQTCASSIGNVSRLPDDAASPIGPKNIRLSLQWLADTICILYYNDILR